MTEQVDNIKARKPNSNNALRGAVSVPSPVSEEGTLKIRLPHVFVILPPISTAMH